MTARIFQITLIHGGMRHTRSIIAPSTIDALRIGIRMMPELDEPCAITCKPAQEAP